MSKHAAQEMTEDRRVMESAALRIGPFNDACEIIARITTGNPRHRAEES